VGERRSQSSPCSAQCGGRRTRVFVITINQGKVSTQRFGFVDKIYSKMLRVKWDNKNSMSRRYGGSLIG
jgi:hypothetical protein